MQREAWQLIPIGYESKLNWMVYIPSIVPKKAVYVKAATLGSSLR
jgi:hypothetical protein